MTDPATSPRPATVEPVRPRDPQAVLSAYELAWPRALFTTMADRLLDFYTTLAPEDPVDDAADPAEAVEQLLAEAFTTDYAARRYRISDWPQDVPAEWADDSHLPDERLLRALAAHVAELPSDAEHTYWSERRTGTTPSLDRATVARLFAQAVEELHVAGYFDRNMYRGCSSYHGVETSDPNLEIARQLGREGLWPLTRSAQRGWDGDTFFDLIELFDRLAARPWERWTHMSGTRPWDGCSGHGEHPDRVAGQLVYRWRINQLLDRSSIGYRLADAGEEAGRLVAVTGDARDDLAEAMAARTDLATGDDVRHAIALFRGRDATVQTKRSANVALAGVLEERRALLKKDLFKGDERALFTIANEFAIRHQNELQKDDYNPAFLDWIFWWYLATIDLTDRLLAHQTTGDTP